MDEEQWFNSLDIKLYLRKPKTLDESELNQIKKAIKKAVPGYDFDTFHVEVNHDEKYCLSGDVFKLEDAKKWNQITEIERTEKHTEQDVKEGKIRKNDRYNIGLENPGDITDTYEDDPAITEMNSEVEKEDILEKDYHQDEDIENEDHQDEDQDQDEDLENDDHQDEDYNAEDDESEYVLNTHDGDVPEEKTVKQEL